MSAKVDSFSFAANSNYGCEGNRAFKHCRDKKKTKGNVDDKRWRGLKRLKLTNLSEKITRANCVVAS